MIILLVWVAVLIAAVVLYFRQLYSSLSRHGVKHFKPVPIFGNMAGILLRIDHVCDSIMKLYNDFPEERFVGRYEFVNELIVIRDIDLIKKIAVKDFEYFLDHRSIFSSSESYFSRNLFSLKGQEWKDMRSTLSPAFTSSKMRLMVPFMVEVGDQMMQSLHQSIKQSKDGSIDIDCKDLTTRYANDVIASCAFGLKVDSHNDKDNSFYALGKETSSFNFRQMMTFFLLINAPALAKFLKLDFLSDSSKEAFKKLVLGTMENREVKKIIRPDMIHLLMEAKKGRPKKYKKTDKMNAIGVKGDTTNDFLITGKLTHEEIKSNDLAAGFATVEESAVGQKEINR
ncbi:hypothetical protein HF086_001114, partial [Spodoptera exigua]